MISFLQGYHGEPHAHETPAPSRLQPPGEVVDPPYPGQTAERVLPTSTTGGTWMARIDNEEGPAEPKSRRAFGSFRGNSVLMFDD